MTKLTKVQKIWQFINFHNPTRKELTCFILGIDSREYKHSNRGHYGTNIAEWKRKGHITVINKRYVLTNESLKDNTGRMYIDISKPTVQSPREAELIQNNCDLGNENITLQKTIDTLVARLQKINEITKIF